MVRADAEFHTSTDESPSTASRVYVAIASVLGAAVLVNAVMHWDSPDLIKYASFLVIAMFSSGFPVSVPGVTGELSLNFLFVLVGLVELNVPETVALAAIARLVQCYWTSEERPSPALAAFQVSSMTLAAAAAERVYHSGWFEVYGADLSIRLAAAALALFILNTAPPAGCIALLEKRSFPAVWWSQCFWSFPYYLGGAAIARLITLAGGYVGWQTILVTGPVMYLVYRSYRLYVHRLEAETKHAEDVASLHLRTIEALALAIEAKDHTTHDHLQRVQVYAMELARELGLSKEERQALRAASLLHDIGKLAVPEHIISKPGRLTPEEFEKMKIHPTVGAEILERVRFPYPVVPIVRAHHEKWDGTGYPAGLRGEDIPIGARILAAVDCLDALASDRQYRRALPLDEAMKVVINDTGKAFDPQVVTALAKHYVEWEKKAQMPMAHQQGSKLSTEVKIKRGEAPAAGFEVSSKPAAVGAAGQSNDAPMDFLTSIASARQEVQDLFETAQDLGNSLSLDETLSVLNVRLRRMVPHHSLAIWLRRDDELVPEYVNGEDYRLLSSLKIPVGQGLSGWVAETGKTIVNGNPSVESGYLNDPSRVSTLRSAVAVPIEGATGILGVLALYHSERDAFSKDHLRILNAIRAKVGMSIENALRFRQAESSATTDFLTTLPNARSLFLQLDAELSRSRRNSSAMAVMVLDLDDLKQINDRLGHLEGNKVLKAVAAGLKSVCREYDYVARMGGDEFVVLVGGLRPNDAVRKVEELREIVGRSTAEIYTVGPVGVSIGTASYPMDGEDAETLLAEADRRMYQEKRGRKAQKAGKGAPQTSTPVWASIQ